jgi:hypothetical protein
MTTWVRKTMELAFPVLEAVTLSTQSPVVFINCSTSINIAKTFVDVCH